jgi:hypothetical protein
MMAGDLVLRKRLWPKLMDVESIVKQFEGAKDVVRTWFSVITRGSQAFQRIDLENSSVLFYSLKFMLYVAFVDLLLHIPLAAAARSTGKAVSIQSLLLLETYLEFLILGFALYGAMRLVGGKGSLQASIAAYCLLTAYLPIISVLMMPMRALIFPGMERHPDLPTVIQEAGPNLSHLSLWEATGFWLSFVLTTLVFVIFFVAIFRTFRMIHELSNARALLGFLLGLISASAILALFVEPFLTSILQSPAASSNPA